MISSLIIRGSFKGTTGYDRHVRAFTKALVAEKISVELQDVKEWSSLKLNKGQQDSWFDKWSRPVKSDRVLHFTMPDQVKIFKNKMNINFTMFEASKIPSAWLEHNLKHHLVIVPTESSKNFWINSGFPEHRIQICPLGIDPDLFHENILSLSLVSKSNNFIFQTLSYLNKEKNNINDYKYRFLNVSELGPRKNLFHLIDVWTQATNKKDNAILILKLQCSLKKYLYKFFWDLKTINKKIKNAAPILFLINKKFTEEEMSSLYKTATHYWSMSHGEGWDLCMMEAGASGLHLIAPKHTSYVEYLNDDFADLLDSKEIPIQFKWTPHMEEIFKDAHWWQPETDITIDIISKIIQDQHTLKSAENHIKDNYTWEKSTKKLMEILANCHFE